MCVKESLQEGQQMPRCRIGHGLYSEDLGSKDMGSDLLNVTLHDVLPCE